MLLKPVEKMTVEELNHRIELHRTTAEMYSRHEEHSMARDFSALAEKYEAEKNRRSVPAVPAEELGWDDPDR